jgi:hypothetical protein
MVAELTDCGVQAPPEPHLRRHDLAPIDDQLQRELCRIRERTRTGASAVELPRSIDGHCDLASALALAVWELERKGVARPLRTSSVLSRIHSAPADRTDLASLLAVPFEGFG